VNSFLAQHTSSRRVAIAEEAVTLAGRIAHRITLVRCGDLVRERLDLNIESYTFDKNFDFFASAYTSELEALTEAATRLRELSFIGEIFLGDEFGKACRVIAAVHKHLTFNATYIVQRLELMTRLPLPPEQIAGQMRGELLEHSLKVDLLAGPPEGLEDETSLRLSNAMDTIVKCTRNLVRG
jgi:hypothetical protein